MSGVLNVERPQPHHLYWPDLDIDLHLDSIDHPERYPHVSQERPNKRLQPTVDARSAGRRRRVASPRARRG